MNQRIRIRASGVLVREGRVLLVRCDDPAVGIHYNLPGGGLEPAETLREAVRRELREETLLDVTVGDLLMTWEFLPDPLATLANEPHAFGFVFRVTAPEEAQPQMPPTPDTFQAGLDWVPIEALPGVNLYPRIAADLQRALRGESGPAIYCLERKADRVR